MSYGHGPSSQTHAFRALPLGVGECTYQKAQGLLELRRAYLACLTRLAEVAFNPDPLLSISGSRQVSKRLGKEQTRYQGLNKAYVEKAKIQVLSAVGEQDRRYVSQILGRLRHAAMEIPEADRKQMEGQSRRFYYVPEGVQERISAGELLDLQARCEKSPAALALIRRVLAGKASTLTDHQIAVVKEIHRQVHQKHRPIVFATADACVSIPLDYRLLPADWKDLSGRLGSITAQILQDPANRCYQFFVDIAPAMPHTARLRIPVSLSPEILESAFSAARPQFDARGLTLILGPSSVQMRLTIAKKRVPAKPLDQVDYVLGRDFGQRNTITLSLIKLEQRLDCERIAELEDLSREAAARWLTQNAHPQDPDIAARLRFSGAGFLQRVNEHTLAIDALRSRIDVAYAELEDKKLKLAAALGLEPDEDGLLPRLVMSMAPRGAPLHLALTAFMRQLSVIKSLKVERRRLYARIARLKKSWFGYLANIECRIAQKWNAAVMAESLTYVAIEKESAAYKGRTFNKVMNQASRGQYARRAQEKHAWNGVPLIELPSWFTSTTCFRHGVINPAFRKRDVFWCTECRKEGRASEHADEHAADMLGVYALLKSKSDNHIWV
jgi:hypothetical protein